MISSLNKIFKKGGNSTGRKPMVSKKCEVPAEIFQNAFHELVYNGNGDGVSQGNGHVEAILEKGLVESGIGVGDKQEEGNKQESATL